MAGTTTSSTTRRCTRKGGAARPHACIMTGAHPEYTSAAMMHALAGYIRDGGRLMYLGGNGFTGG